MCNVSAAWETSAKVLLTLNGGELAGMKRGECAGAAFSTEEGNWVVKASQNGLGKHRLERTLYHLEWQEEGDGEAMEGSIWSLVLLLLYPWGWESLRWENNSLYLHL